MGMFCFIVTSIVDLGLLQSDSRSIIDNAYFPMSVMLNQHNFGKPFDIKSWYWSDAQESAADLVLLNSNSVCFPKELDAFQS